METPNESDQSAVALDTRGLPRVQCRMFSRNRNDRRQHFRQSKQRLDICLDVVKSTASREFVQPSG